MILLLYHVCSTSDSSSLGHPLVLYSTYIYIYVPLDLVICTIKSLKISFHQDGFATYLHISGAN